MHNLLAREIIVDRVGDCELYFGIGGRQLRFLKYEFCLLTGLKFEGQTIFQPIIIILSKVVSFKDIG